MTGIHPSQDIAFVLPVTLQQLTPTWVYLVVLGVVIMVAMSSIDTLTLSSSVMFSNNIYRHFRVKVCNLFRDQTFCFCFSHKVKFLLTSIYHVVIVVKKSYGIGSTLCA